VGEFSFIELGMGCGASKAKPPQPAEILEASPSAPPLQSETSVAPEAVRIQEGGGGGASTLAKAEELRVKLGLTAAPSEAAAMGASSEDDAATSDAIAQACAKLQVDPGSMTLAEQARTAHTTPHTQAAPCMHTARPLLLFPTAAHP
jgi:hypothetical protein